MDRDTLLGQEAAPEAEPDEVPELQQFTSAPQATLEERLRAQAKVTEEQVQQARQIHEKTPRKRIGQILLDMGVITETDLLRCLAEQYDLPFVRIDPETVDQKTLRLLDIDFIGSRHILPIGFEGEKLVVATPDPANVFLLDEVARKTGRELIVQVCTAEDITLVVGAQPTHEIDGEIDDIIKDIEEDEVEVVASQEHDWSDIEREAAESPIIKFVNYIITNAISEGASDIHVEPGDKKLKIRFRIDGILFEMMSPPYTMHAAVVSRVKIMANLDISERRLPQDGRIRVAVRRRNIDMRVSTMPSSYGEKIVIRIIDDGATSFTLVDMGLHEDTLAILDHQIRQPHGIILVTGPTGSGKSTTLYACIRAMDLKKQNISTVEDPVEFQLEDVTQVQVHDHIGMTFALALRSLLRQDPDIIMVGEIRDEETARVAVQASLTGHLVLSTLHTNDAPSSITRLVNIGIEPYLIAASTNAVLAQRLVRRICTNCKEQYLPTPEHAAFMEMHAFDSKFVFAGTGCDQCRHTGFHGRVGLYELLTIDDTYRDLITTNPTVTELRRLCRERGMVSLRDEGLRKVELGITTIDEVMRVTEAIT